MTAEPMIPAGHELHEERPICVACVRNLVPLENGVVIRLLLIMSEKDVQALSDSYQIAIDALEKTLDRLENYPTRISGYVPNADGSASALVENIRTALDQAKETGR